ncbi:unnamed protein product [Adineta ricciae]|uniref:Helix-turn-helix domain-containing protein n=1 Tax=Adineta ricciae TaxID=249248 RepID=A0A816CYD4_ADIRI|nr:unnamed protein product [Adineta ricciae]
MIHRALNICSTYESLAIEFENIRQIGFHNGYSKSFIDTRIGTGLTKFLNPSVTNTSVNMEEEKKKMYIEVPYTGATTKPFTKQLARISEKLRPDLDVRFYAKPPPPVQIHFNTKDPVPKHLQSNVVYSVKCAHCDDFYVGETERQIIRRLWEHGAPKSLFQTNIISLDETNNSLNEENNNIQIENTQVRKMGQHVHKTMRQRATPYPTSENRTEVTIRKSRRPTANNQSTPPFSFIYTGSAISRHINETNHTIDWEHFKLVWRDGNHHKLLTKESLVIQAYQPQLNRTTHSSPMYIFPEGLPQNLIPDPQINH